MTMMRTRLVPLALLVASVAACVTRTATSTSYKMGPAPYEAYAVRFGSVAGYPTRSLVIGADSSRRTDLAMTVWLLRGNGRTILVDAGFYRDKFVTRWKPTTFVKPTEALAVLGIRPEDVTDIIISHVHWDHIDGVDLFPQARIWIQRAEYEHHTNDSGAVLDRMIDPDDAKMIAGLKRAGRVQLIDGDSVEILPRITVYTGGKHTYASQFVQASTMAGEVIFASDNAYLYENLDQHRPIAQTLDSLSNLRAQTRMLRLASEPRLVIPGHDAQVFARFPSAGEGVVRIR